ncbi:MAG: prepilin-type N-terminal cleavage/methylation domain-containing protein [Planctomycetes bacterium]|nr:prepilin-type N-terminal cleavage/methylation domain-containing protein [Planctomycetota bacterium]
MHTSPLHHRAVPAQPSGFTLVEVLVAILITSVIMLTVSTTLFTTMSARKQVDTLTESTEAGSRILALIERDLRGLWTHNIKKNAVLKGVNRDIAGPPADRIDFLTNTDSIATVQSTTDHPVRASVCEVGYWLRSNPSDPLLMELYRREDPMVDDDLTRGGTFQLVHNRIREFNITYYKTLGHNAEEFNDWDSSTDDALPRVIKVEFTIERKLSSSNEVQSREVSDFENNNKKYVRYIVLEKDQVDLLKPQAALIPVLPTRPKALDEKGGNGQGNSPSGPGGALGPAGPGRAVSFGGDGQQQRGQRGQRGNQGGERGGNRGNNGRTGGRSGSQGLPNGFPGLGQGSNSGGFDINSLIRQFGGTGGVGGRGR